MVSIHGGSIIKDPFHHFKNFHIRAAFRNGSSSCICCRIKGKTVKYESNDVEGVEIGAVSYGYRVYGLSSLLEGIFTLESASGKPVAIIGSNISEELFQGVDHLGKR